MYLIFNADRLVSIPYYGPMKMAHGFAGAILMDLVVHEKIEVMGNKIRVIDTTFMVDDLLKVNKINFYFNFYCALENFKLFLRSNN